MILVFTVWILFTVAMTIDLLRASLFAELILSFIFALAYLFLSYQGKVDRDVVRTFFYMICGVPIAYLILLFVVTSVLYKYRPGEEWATGAGMMAFMVGVLHTFIFTLMFGVGYLLQLFARK
ncbi:MAG TPA: hypothetical protein VK171_07565 [Fimbriimonas sp.]|nr:hypothetical protein [Fimbriimonas sp.]